MAPSLRALSELSAHLNKFQRRDEEEHMTWVALGIALGVLGLLIVVGVWAVWFRTRKNKQLNEIKKKRQSQASMQGSYVKLDDRRMSFDEAARPLVSEHSETAAPSKKKTRSRSSSRESTSKLMRGKEIEDTAVQMQNLGRRSRADNLDEPYRGRSTSPHQHPPNFTHLDIGNAHDHHSLFLPPPPATLADSSAGANFSREQHQIHQFQGRSASPAPSVLGRSITMLRPREDSPEKPHQMI